MERIHNFSAGPGVLPEEVLLEIQQDLLSYKGNGLSVMEMSHRSKEYEEIFNETVATMKRLLKVTDDYAVLFLSGGAHTQFLMTAMNLIQEGKVGNYVLTGEWASKAYKEAKKIGKLTHVAASSEDKNFSYLPKAFNISENPAYLHYCSNNTIFGTEYRDDSIFPTNIPLICDMSSDFLSRPLDINKYALIYAGAQKNIGPAGTTAVIIRKDMIDKFAPVKETMLSYKTHIDGNSMYNTPPTFPIYIVGLVLKWIEKQGLENIEKNNIAKAGLIYDVIDNSEFYKGTTAKEDRSLMNITFRLASEELEEKFIKEAKSLKISGIKGHRSVGGCRASTYNALPKKACEVLAEFMIKFAKDNG
ncbi:MAG: 3-phosphoserine/phosphohydroxythreonine transaminase [Candidatus Cloacimonetes bacterium]|nr:3-phosphoserine/phosphohydroxythreonine transaminase [Candidatus Cloacimonadota bacterium]